MTSDTALFDPAPLRPFLETADRPWLLLTPNRRLASRISGALAAQKPVAEVAPVRALGDWLDILWQQMVFRGDPLAQDLWVLSAAQELCVWESCIAASPEGGGLLRARAAAEQAVQAQRTLLLWQRWPLGQGRAATALRAEFDASPDSRVFLEWLERFAAHCTRLGCIVSAERDRRVLDAARKGRLSLPEQILGVGFDDIPPLYRDLCGSANRFVQLDLPARHREAVCVSCEGFEEQLQAAALWVRRRLRDDPAGPYAIVVPDLGQQRPLVERVLLDVLTPEHALPGGARQLPPVNFSAGDALAQTPLVQSALQLLELALPQCERGTLLALLQSPFHALDLRHAEAAAACIRAVCETPAQRLRGGQLRAIADRVASQYDDWEFAALLQQLVETVRREKLLEQRLSLTEWARRFGDLLVLLGWPGKRTLDSIEYQQFSHWQRALADFGQLDRVAAPTDFNGALQRLRQSLQAHVFQPKTADAPLQVLGVLEAAGLQFKGLWLCDMGEDRWPPAASPQAFLPRDLQRRERMPRCDAQREYDIAERLGHSLLANAQQVVVSFQGEREEVECAPSPLFQHLPLADLPALLDGAPLREQLPQWRWQREQRARFALQAVAAGNAPRLSGSERARGGSGLFKDQAACPFRAFARHRLGAAKLGEAREGLNAAERGNLLHWALEWLWRRLENHERLLALDESAQQHLVIEAATFALEQLPPLRLGLRFAALENTRLAQLLARWLDIEKQRGAFAVQALEQRSDVQFGGLDLRLRVDRIDRLPDGRLLVLDYKTKNGHCRPEEWLGARPDEPQLPLYSVLLEAERAQVAGIAFAQVRLESPRLVGAGDAGLDAHAIQDSNQLRDDVDTARAWPELKNYWRAVLAQLADAFVQGEAAIDPKTPQVCAYCDLASVCRVDHQDAVLAGATPDTEEPA